MFTTESTGERILKINQQLAKLRARVWCLVLFNSWGGSVIDGTGRLSVCLLHPVCSDVMSCCEAMSLCQLTHFSLLYHQLEPRVPWYGQG